MKKMYAAIGLVLFMTLGLGAVVWAASTDPGSEADPLVTKSYVDEKIGQAGGAFTPVEIKAGQTVIGGEGTELILRSGEATVIGSESNGIADLTGGEDLGTGAVVQPNHLLLVPRDDGRGIAATTDMWVMIRGSYTVQ